MCEVHSAFRSGITTHLGAKTRFRLAYSSLRALKVLAVGSMDPSYSTTQGMLLDLPPVVADSQAADESAPVSSHLKLAVRNRRQDFERRVQFEPELLQVLPLVHSVLDFDLRWLRTY